MDQDFSIKMLYDEALTFLDANLEACYCYHNAEHTKAVYDAAGVLADAAGLTGAPRRALLLAALFHDFGYLVRAQENETLAWPFLQKFGKKYVLPEALLTEANNLIQETVYPYNPVTPGGKLLCDADIEYIGRECFWQQAGLFRQELAALGRSYDDAGWWRMELDFLRENSFFTPECRQLRGQGRLENIVLLERLVSGSTTQGKK